MRLLLLQSAIIDEQAGFLELANELSVIVELLLDSRKGSNEAPR